VYELPLLTKYIYTPIERQLPSGVHVILTSPAVIVDFSIHQLSLLISLYQSRMISSVEKEFLPDSRIGVTKNLAKYMLHVFDFSAKSSFD
jgi:hypothetical protein